MRVLVGVLYPGYRGTLVTAQHYNPAWDTPGLPAAVPSGFEYQDCRHLDSQYRQKNPSPGGFTSPGKGSTAHYSDKTVPDRTNSTSLSSQVKPAPHSTNSRNLLECHPPQRQELPGTDENTIEAPNRPQRTDHLKSGPH
jgi:hypothetical protein